jgi:hypothetical protein
MQPDIRAATAVINQIATTTDRDFLLGRSGGQCGARRRSVPTCENGSAAYNEITPENLFSRLFLWDLCLAIGISPTWFSDALFIAEIGFLAMPRRSTSTTDE